MTTRNPTVDPAPESGSATVDTILTGLGVSAAVVSASFAGYMALVGPGHLGARRTSDDFTVFAPYERHPPARTAAEPPANAPSGDGTGIDFTPTGSVAGAESSDAGNQDDPAPGGLQDFAVRDVFDGTALVETRGTLQLVRPGTTLADAGKVLSIDRKGSGWVVVTSSGTIHQRP